MGRVGGGALRRTPSSRRVLWRWTRKKEGMLKPKKERCGRWRTAVGVLLGRARVAMRRERRDLSRVAVWEEVGWQQRGLKEDLLQTKEVRRVARATGWVGGVEWRRARRRCRAPWKVLRREEAREPVMVKVVPKERWGWTGEAGGGG